ncbi:MAG: phage tail tape measure protein, partial [Synergistaceae bacterium]|nr:phage tail tape measure protein [Synergistaceae bacterium]
NDINNAMKGMTDAQQVQALTKIFGKDAVPGIRAMMKEIEQGTFTELDQKAEGAKGTSYEMMQKQLATLRGQMTLAGSAISDVMIEIGNVLLPYATDIVKGLTAITGGITSLMREFPGLTKVVVGGLGAFAAWKVGFVGLKIGWNLLKLPFQSARVAIDFLNLKLVAQGKQAGMLSKVWRGLKSGLQGVGGAFKAVGKGFWGAFKGLGNVAFDVGKLAAYKAKAVAVTVATQAWTVAQKLWGLAMKGAGKLLDVGKLALYYVKQLVIAAAIAIGYLLYKNWDKLKEWWNSWTIKDVFAVIKDYAGRAWSYVVGKWNEFWAFWDKLTLSNIFAALGGYIDDSIAYVKGKWQEFTDWLSSLNPFKDWTPPTVDAETAKAMKAETLQKYGTLDLRPGYMRGEQVKISQPTE